MGNSTCEINVRKGQSVDKALRILKRTMTKEGIMRDIRSHQYFEKPSDKKRRKSEQARKRKARAARNRKSRKKRFWTEITKQFGTETQKGPRKWVFFR